MELAEVELEWEHGREDMYRFLKTLRRVRVLIPGVTVPITFNGQRSINDTHTILLRKDTRYYVERWEWAVHRVEHYGAPARMRWEGTWARLYADEDLQRQVDSLVALATGTNEVEMLRTLLRPYLEADNPPRWRVADGQD